MEKKENKLLAKVAKLVQNGDCDHPSLLFFMEDFTFRCMKCNKKLIKLSTENEFRLFCGCSGNDPEKLMA